MKYLIYPLFISLIILTSCSNENDVKLETYNADVFAFDIGDEYEVNATITVKGFELKGEGTNYKASVHYQLDLIKPDGTIEKAFLKNTEDLTFNEEVKDAGIDIQFNLDSTYKSGDYTLIFNMKDIPSGKTATTSAKFNLE